MDSNHTEQTLCAWCGKPLEHNGTVIYSNEHICHECYGLHLRVKRSAMKFWKGVKNGQLR